MLSLLLPMVGRCEGSLLAKSVDKDEPVENERHTRRARRCLCFGLVDCGQRNETRFAYDQLWGSVFCLL